MLLKCTMSNAAPCIDFEPTPLSERLVELREALKAAAETLARRIKSTNDEKSIMSSDESKSRPR